MSKPKNMTPDQEAAWKEKERQRRSSPEYKAKQKARSRRWYDQGGKEKTVSNIAQKRKDLAFVDAERAAERRRVAENPFRKQKAQENQKQWRSTEVGSKKNCAKAMRYYERNAEEIKERRKGNRRYDAFMRTIEEEARSC